MTVSDIAVTATVRLSLAPLVSVAPGFSAASFSLLSRPMVRGCAASGASRPADDSRPVSKLWPGGCKV